METGMSGGFNQWGFGGSGHEMAGGPATGGFGGGFGGHGGRR